MSIDRIDMRLHEIERVYYDPKADFWAGVALDDVSATTGAKLMRKAETLSANVTETATPVVINVEGQLGFGHDAEDVGQEERWVLSARGDRVRGARGGALRRSGERHVPRAPEAQGVHA